MKLIDKLAKYLLIILLAITVAGDLMTAVINPEAYLMISKLEGLSAQIYLSLNLMIALLFMYAAIKVKYIIWIALLTIFFGFHLLNSIMTSLVFFGNLSISGISLIGVMVSMTEFLRALALR